ncbi:hypothetical protein CRI94_04135 [Longibacter salinarum]|uniref:Secretion system C-terminal sorting domain-containing protein n=1 Tax=Longibacter salinarum TaxID=1850348 RepID=A0A2A8CZX1_9BACT|nr:T9SS type A sorting domain-containing protein [Longibacter salinarum]PEN14235.1 hypothetical protein CRI94_04135 [Longibacter salinarum]
MKRTVTSILTLLVVAAWCAAPAFSQTSFDRDWEFSANVNSGSIPAYLTDARAIAYGMVDDGSGTMVGRLLVSHGGDNVEIVDPADGQSLGTLSTNGIQGTSTRNIQDVEVTGDNIIIGCNSVNNTFAPGDVTDFRCYRWDDLGADPVQVLSFPAPDANNDGESDYIGRLVDVKGNANDNTLTILTAASAFQDSGVNDVYRFTTTDNAQSFSSETVDRPDGEPFDNLNGVAAIGTGDAPFIYNAGGAPPTRYAADGTSPEAVPSGAGIVSSFTNSVEYFETSSGSFFATFNYEMGGNGSKATVVDVTSGFSAALPYDSTPSMGGGPPNGAGDIDVRNNGDGTVTVFVVSADTGIGSFTTNTDPLPVELASFEADRDGNNVALRWETLSETGNSGFDIERSIDGRAFTKVGFEPGQGTTTEATSYRFVDNSIPYGVSDVTYRLRQIDVDGDETLTDARSITFTPSSVSLVGSVPNPVASGQAEIRFELPKAMNVRLSVYDLLGREVAVLVDGEQMAKQHRVSFDASTLASGTYLIRLETDRGATTSKMTIAR